MKSAHVIAAIPNAPRKRTYHPKRQALPPPASPSLEHLRSLCDNGSGGTSHKQASTQAVQNLTSTGTTRQPLSWSSRTVRGDHVVTVAFNT